MTGEEWVLCVDPGKMTGVAGLYRKDNYVELRFSEEVDEDHVAECLRPILASYSDGVPLRVVIERFTITAQTAKNSQAPYSLEVIGVVKQCLRDVDYPLDKIVWQFPSAAKEMVTNKRIRNLDLWHTGGAGHALDAIRHGVLYLISRGWTDSRFLQ